MPRKLAKLRISSVLVCALAAGALVACTSSGGSNASDAASAGSTGASAANVSGSVQPSSGDAATGTASSAAAATEALARVRQEVVKARTFPTRIGPTTPLNHKPVPGKTIVYIACDAQQCGLEASQLAAAASAVGWKEKTLNYQGSNPSTLVSAMKTALQYKPVAVVFAGVPEALWKTELSDYRKAGVVIIPQSVPDLNVDDVAIAGTLGQESAVEHGKLLADYLAADSGGTAKIVTANVSQYPRLATMQQALSRELASVCPDCRIVDNVDVSIATLSAGGFVPAIISALKRNPGATYLEAANGVFINGIESALKVAGLEGKIKIVTDSPSVSDLQAIQQGEEDATFVSGLGVSMWLTMDVALRHEEGMPIGDPDAESPDTLLDKSNVFIPDNTGDVNLPKDYQDQFKKLWKVGA